ncbi:MAG: efflux RND transporter periplasmic adaptor subunit [Betaproteobacteria bacterium]|nr:efflux RND transporter periplasmic adaptor subunit [Betaproteobacteria bacterium]
MPIDRKSAIAGAVAGGLLFVAAFAVYFAWERSSRPDSGDDPATTGRATPALSGTGRGKPAVLGPESIELSASEYSGFAVRPVEEREFTVQREAVGTIDFNQELSVQVFAPFPGKIIELYKKAGDAAKSSEVLYTIDSSDLLQAESTLLSAAGTLRTTARALERAKELYEVQGVAQKDLDQALSDQQAAEGAFKAAQDAVRIFGKTNADVKGILEERRIDSILRVVSPIAGVVTARSAAPGLLVQPGNAPAPYAVADVSTKWLLANVNEYDVPLLRLGQQLEVAVQAYPGAKYVGVVVNIGAAVDPNTHKVLVRSVVRDPRQQLRPGMLATFAIRAGKALRSPGVPYAGIVRESDGTMTVWVAKGGTRLSRRTVKTGLQQNGYTQIVEGLSTGEAVATQGALFLDNALTSASR